MLTLEIVGGSEESQVLQHGKPPIESAVCGRMKAEPGTHFSRLTLDVIPGYESAAGCRHE
jgi:hypothetical protein